MKKNEQLYINWQKKIRNLTPKFYGNATFLGFKNPDIILFYAYDNLESSITYIYEYDIKNDIYEKKYKFTNSLQGAIARDEKVFYQDSVVIDSHKRYILVYRYDVVSNTNTLIGYYESYPPNFSLKYVLK